MNFLMGVAKGALDRGSELIEERSQRRQKMVDQLTVKYLETAEKAKARRALEKQNVTKAAQFFKQNNLPPELLERAILSAKSPDDIFENAMTMGSQWQRARTNEQTRGMFSGPADQFDRDYSEGYSDLQRMTERLSTGPTEDSPIGSTGGFGTPVAEAASNQALKDAASFAGMRPEELAGAVRNAPRGSEAGLGATEGISQYTEDELKFRQDSQPEKPKAEFILSLSKEASKSVATEMGIDVAILPNGEVNFGTTNAELRREFVRRQRSTLAGMFSDLGYPDIAASYSTRLPVDSDPQAQLPAMSPAMKSAFDRAASAIAEKSNGGKPLTPQQQMQLIQELRAKGFK